MEKKAVKGISIGYDNDDGYRVWCKENNTLIRSRDVPIPFQGSAGRGAVGGRVYKKSIVFF